MFSYMRRGRDFYRQVVTLAAPIVLQNLITSTLAMADTFMVGLLGEAPMAAVTLANIPLFVIQLFIFGTQSGASVLHSQYWGRQDMKAINRVLGVSFWVAGSLSALMAAILLICPVPFLSLFCNQPEVVALGALYGRWAGLSFFFDSFVMMYIAAYRSMERPRLGMYILIVSMVVNTFLNWVLIFGKLGLPALGVEGAAIATLCARMLEVAIVIVHACLTRGFKLDLPLLLRPGKEMFVRFFRFGGPVVFNETMWGLGTSVFPAIMGHMENSTEILAAFTIAGNIDKLCMVFSFGLGATATIIIGREVGAGRTEEVCPVGMALDTLACLCGAFVGVLLFLFARFFAPAYVFPLFHMSAGAGTIATMMMVMQSCIRPIRDFNSVNIVGVLRGGGDVKMATLIDTTPLWCVAIPLAFLCGIVLKTGIFWVYLMMLMEQIVKVFFGLHRVRSDGWIRDLTRTDYDKEDFS